MIVQNVTEDDSADISFTVPRHESSETIDVVGPVVEAMGGKLGVPDEHVSKVSVVGMGMAHQTGVAARMFKSLADANVNIQMITTSEIKISVLVPRDQSLKALCTVHNEFKLDKGVTVTDEFDFSPESKRSISQQ